MSHKAQTEELAPRHRVRRFLRSAGDPRVGFVVDAEIDETLATTVHVARATCDETRTGARLISRVETMSVEKLPAKTRSRLARQLRELLVGESAAVVDAVTAAVAPD